MELEALERNALPSSLYPKKDQYGFLLSVTYIYLCTGFLSVVAIKKYCIILHDVQILTDRNEHVVRDAKRVEIRYHVQVLDARHEVMV